MSTIKIWYQLVKEDGIPMGSAAKVFLSPGADVDDFRKQVKAENAVKLRAVDASDLSVYLNKTAYESRATVAQLEEDAGVAGLGHSKVNALVVLVPTTETHGIGLGGRENYLISGTMLHAKKTKGVRSTLYRLASTYLGYHDGEERAFWYDGDDLKIHLLFESKQNADYFRRRLDDESLIHNSAISQLKVAQISLFATQNTAGKEILGTDYNPDDFDSPQIALSMVSGTTSILDSTRPIFKFQRIESDSIFGQHYKACSCHLVSREYLAKNSEYDDAENNRLALSGDVHNWFDGKSVDVPLFKLTVPTESVSRRPILENRYEVLLLVTAYDSDSARLLFPRLREGYTVLSELEATISVYVLKPKVFKECIEWKALEIQEKWDSYNNMEPAVS